MTKEKNGAVSLSAQTREGSAGHLRAEGMTPAVLYGHGIESQNLQVNTKEFAKALSTAGRTTIITLKTGNDEFKVLVKDVQRDPLSEAILHADFYQVRLDEKVTASVPLVFTGESVAVKDFGGTLLRNQDKVDVEALPLDLPRDIVVDVSILSDFEKTIKISDLPLPDGVEVLADAEAIVALVQAPRTAEDLEKLNEEIEENVEDIEGVADKKDGAEDKDEASSDGEEKKEE